MSTTSILPFVLAAARRGWRVFPLRCGDKRPVPGLTAWEQHATTDAKRIRSHWGTHPRHNYAVACGSGLVVIDLDTPKDAEQPPAEWAMPGITDGADVLAALAEQHGANADASWLDTFTVRTRRGGLHLYYTAPPGAELRNTAGRIGWLIDTRASGGYVVGPGSHVADAAGRGPYTVANPAPAAPLPEWLTGLLAPAPLPPQQPVAVPLTAHDRRSAYLRSAVTAEVERVTRSGPRHHNTALYQAAVALGQLVAGGELTESEVTAWLAEAATQVGQKPAEIPRTIASGLRAGAKRPRKVAA